MGFCDMRIQKKDIIAWLCLAAATLAALVLISARLCETHLSVRYYEVASEKIMEPLRIVQLTDLHGHVFGEANAELAELVAEQQPDLIVMTGDMLDKTDADASVVCELIRALQDVAPIYYCHGNHEKTWMASTGIDLDSQLTEAGAIVLDTAFADITVNGQPLRIGGYHGYYRYWGMLTKSKEQWAAEDAFSDAFEDTEQFKLLLCHIPTGWIDWSLIDRACGSGSDGPLPWRADPDSVYRRIVCSVCWIFPEVYGGNVWGRNGNRDFVHRFIDQPRDPPDQQLAPGGCGGFGSCTVILMLEGLCLWIRNLNISSIFWGPVFGERRRGSRGKWTGSGWCSWRRSIVCPGSWAIWQ